MISSMDFSVILETSAVGLSISIGPTYQYLCC
jgi:hypothetical protein